MTNEELAELAKKDSKAMGDLIEKNRGLIFQCFHAHFIFKINEVDPDDIFQVGALGIMKAVKKYKHSRGKFSTYAFWWIRNHIQRYLDKDYLIKNRKRAVLDENFLLSIPDREHESESEKLSIYFIVKNMNVLTKRQKEYMELFFSSVRSRDIAEKMGISKQAANQLKARSIKRLLTYFGVKKKCLKGRIV